MIVALRRGLAGAALGAVLALGAAPVDAVAETPVATPSATASPTAAGTDIPTAAVTPPAPTGDSDTPDVAPDNSRRMMALGAAGALALVAALLVFLRRR